MRTLRSTEEILADWKKNHDRQAELRDELAMLEFEASLLQAEQMNARQEKEESEQEL